MRAIGVNTWVWTSPLTDANLPDLLRHIAALGFDAVELPLENVGDISPGTTRAVLAETGLTPYVVGAMAPGRDLVATDAGTVAGTQDYLRACVDLAEAIGAASVCGPFYAQTGRAWRLEARRTRGGVRRVAGQPRARRLVRRRREACGSGSSRSTATRPRSSTPSTRRWRRSARCSGRGSGWRSTPTTSTSRSARAPTPSGGPASTSCTSRSAAATGAHRAATRPTGRRCSTALDEVGYAGPLNIESFTPDNAAIAVAASIWRPLAASPDDLARDGLAFLRSVQAAAPTGGTR